MSSSPYKDVAEENWFDKTQELVEAHPIKAAEFQDVVLSSWSGIFESRIGATGFKIGTDLFPKPQILGFFLHELIALEFMTRYPALWRGEEKASDKDLVHIPDDRFSVEIKTSSHPKQIFGNRSYAQEADSKKSKSGYYLAVNFEQLTKQVRKPRVRRIRFGWLDHADWIGQTAASGQQARLASAVERYKLLTLFDLE
ncbi:MAG: ScaI family restriction endonuclease [Solimonas sp.]